ncbi:hypothetical protein BU23DRAFT_506147 [Bimuria novae-zelandiae CBS 107.79]|uniref:Uncharacterized protein n=1 Tax=Bimuria novae-zelandiae CBS 107.79 TaxID=1447943 RepID=A0A6A5VD61_9PLEO|nr:hypothetical protein BU23DRAFT_506147 [Bimuria novae-zelandiae CBS 107.79]
MIRLGSMLLALAAVGFAATPIPNISPLGVTGAFGGCTTDTGDYNSGGTISVDGWSIKVPKNLLVQFPVVWAKFRDLCAAGVDGYEVSVFGNIIAGTATAAQIIVNAGFSVRAGVGYIDSIDVADGSFTIRGLGTKLRLSDPNGRFGKASNLAPFFPVDDENPSISAFSGFPMCFPRSANDPKCPSSNRPAGSTNFAAPDPLSMVPFLVGDYITYTALPKGGELLVYEASATNVQVTTSASSTVPNYIFVEDAIIGVTDNSPNVEVADSRFIGYLSSCAGASVSVFAIEVDPCTGDETERQVGSATPRAGDVRCKWEARVAVSTPYTREYVVKTNNPVIETKDGIKAGQYVTPVTEWIQPEINVPGAEPVPYDFADIRGLVQGDFLDGEQFGQLDPFPGPSPPAPSKTCSPNDPNQPTANEPVAFIAAFTADQRGGATILLKAQNNNTRLSNSQLNFAWTQVKPAAASASVTIQNPTSPTATFVAPKVASLTTLNFELTISLKSDTTVTSKASVAIKVVNTAADEVTLDTYTWESRQSGTIGVTCHSNVANGDNKAMTLALNNNATRLVMTRVGNVGSGQWSYSARSVKQPTNVQCYSDLGGKSALVTAPARKRKRGVLGWARE